MGVWRVITIEKSRPISDDLKTQLDNTTQFMVLSMLTNMPQDKNTLAEAIGITERKFRITVKELRDKGLPICTDPDGGYYYGSRKEGLIEARKLRHRAYELLKTAERMEGYDPDQMRWEDI